MATSLGYKSLTILSGPSDWDEWIGIIRTNAIAADIWPYINPSVQDDNEPPMLTKPKLPTPTDIKAERAIRTVTIPLAATPSSEAGVAHVDMSPLTEDERNNLNMRRHIYKQDLAVYERQNAALRNLPVSIQESISRTYLYYTLECDTAYEMLKVLEKRVAPTDRARIFNLSYKYQKFLEARKTQNSEDKLQQWEKKDVEGQELGLPEKTCSDGSGGVRPRSIDKAELFKGQEPRLPGETFDAESIRHESIDNAEVFGQDEVNEAKHLLETSEAPLSSPEIRSKENPAPNQEVLRDIEIQVFWIDEDKLVVNQSEVGKPSQKGAAERSGEAMNIKGCHAPRPPEVWKWQSPEDSPKNGYMAEAEYGNGDVNRNTFQAITRADVAFTAAKVAELLQNAASY